MLNEVEIKNFVGKLAELVETDPLLIKIMFERGAGTPENFPVMLHNWEQYGKGVLIDYVKLRNLSISKRNEYYKERNNAN